MQELVERLRQAREWYDTIANEHALALFLTLSEMNESGIRPSFRQLHEEYVKRYDGKMKVADYEWCRRKVQDLIRIGVVKNMRSKHQVKGEGILEVDYDRIHSFQFYMVPKWQLKLFSFLLVASLVSISVLLACIPGLFGAALSLSLPMILLGIAIGMGIGMFWPYIQQSSWIRAMK